MVNQAHECIKAIASFVGSCLPQPTDSKSDCNSVTSHCPLCSITILFFSWVSHPMICPNNFNLPPSGSLFLLLMSQTFLSIRFMGKYMYVKFHTDRTQAMFFVYPQHDLASLIQGSSHSETACVTRERANVCVVPPRPRRVRQESANTATQMFRAGNYAKITERGCGQYQRFVSTRSYLTTIFLYGHIPPLMPTCQCTKTRRTVMVHTFRRLPHTAIWLACWCSPYRPRDCQLPDFANILSVFQSCVNQCLAFGTQDEHRFRTDTPCDALGCMQASYREM